ncbi:MAG: iron-sulfur cluster assembly scaffold protein [Candidatus Hodarchaeales archaeon]
MSNIYSENILHYYKNPKNKGKIENPTFEFSENNPLCGDKIEIQVLLDDQDNIKDIKWDGVGCAISQASASILSQMVKLEKMNLDDVRKLDKDDLLEQLGISLSPNRLKCALLSLGTLKSGVITHLGMKESGDILVKPEKD